MSRPRSETKSCHLAHGVEEVADIAEDVFHPDPLTAAFGIVRQLQDGIPVIVPVLFPLGPVRNVLAHGPHDDVAVHGLGTVDVLFEPVDGSPADRRVVGEQAKAVLSQFPPGGKGNQFQAAVIADGLNVVPVILPGIGQLDLQPVIADLLGLFAKLLNGPRRIIGAVVETSFREQATP